MICQEMEECELSHTAPGKKKSTELFKEFEYSVKNLDLI